MKRLSILIALLMVNICFAADHYILDGGSGNGSAWNNAWDDLPSSFTRGDRYFVGDGTYGAHLFNTDKGTESKYIYIIKATDANHGASSTGWQASYGDGQAKFELPSESGTSVCWEFRSYRWYIDGQVGGGPDDYEGAIVKHGFKVCGPADHVLTGWPPLVLLGDGSGVGYNSDYTEFHHVEFTHLGYANANAPTGCVGGTSYDCAGILLRAGIYDATYGLLDTSNEPGTKHVTISDCYFHDAGGCIQLGACDDWTIENSAFCTTYESSWAVRYGGSRCITAYRGSNYTIRYNYFHNSINSTGCLVFYCYNSGTSPYPAYSIYHDIDIYGNIFKQDTAWWELGGYLGPSGYGTIMVGAVRAGYPSGVDGFRVYNNSFVNIHDNAGFGGGTTGLYIVPSADANTVVNVDIQNNVFYTMTQWAGLADFISGEPYSGHEISIGNNWYADITCTGVNQDVALVAAETNGQHGSGDPFTSWATGDFTLTAATDAGKTLSAPYNQDAYGNTRGADGTWDRGAFEYNGEPESQPPAKATIYAPADNATNIDFDDTALKWNTVYAGCHYHVFKGYGIADTNITPSGIDVNYVAAGTLHKGHKIVWQVYSYDANGQTTGTTWTFYTEPNAPAKPTTPSPADTATGQSVSVNVSWVSGADAFNGDDNYDVYFGTDSDPDAGELQGNQTALTFDPGQLLYSTTYYWRIDSNNLAAGVTTGDTWSFTTMADPNTQDAVRTTVAGIPFTWGDAKDGSVISLPCPPAEFTGGTARIYRGTTLVATGATGQDINGIDDNRDVDGIGGFNVTELDLTESWALPGYDYHLIYYQITDSNDDDVNMVAAYGSIENRTSLTSAQAKSAVLDALKNPYPAGEISTTSPLYQINSVFNKLGGLNETYAEQAVRDVNNFWEYYIIKWLEQDEDIIGIGRGY